MIDFDKHQEMFEECATMTNRVFKTLLGAFPSIRVAIKTQEDLNNMKCIWHKAFIENGLFTNDGIEEDLFSRGIKKTRCLNQSFAPSCGEFIALCKEE
jgi:hypothetical protein